MWYLIFSSSLRLLRVIKPNNSLPRFLKNFLMLCLQVFNWILQVIIVITTLFIFLILNNLMADADTVIVIPLKTVLQDSRLYGMPSWFFYQLEFINIINMVHIKNIWLQDFRLHLSICSAGTVMHVFFNISIFYILSFF